MSLRHLSRLYLPRAFPKRPFCSSLDPSPTLTSKITTLPTVPLPEITPPARTLIRPATEQLRNYITRRDAPAITLVSGPKGVGKSTLLTQTVAYARNKGYVIIYIPRARDWTHGGGFFAAANEAGETDSAVGFEGKGVRWWDRPMEMKELFENLLAAHAEDLKEVEISVKECVESDMTEGCENVTQLLEKGVRLMDDIDSNWRLYPLQAGEILSLVIENLLASDVRTGVVIDDYHMLTGMTNMRNSKQRRLHANGIRFVAQHLGRDAIEETARKNENGFVIVATENEPPFEEWRSSRVLGGSQWPLSDESRSDASGRIWWDSFRRRVETLQVPELKGGELKAICSTFSRGGLRERERDDGRGSVDRLVALAGGRADVMRKVFEVR